MGSPVSVTVANLVMEDIEDKGISTYPSPPPFWKRFVDDIITALPKVSVQPFLNHLNSIEETINFTVELESNGELSFLDTTVKHNSNGTLSTTVFRKKTHTDKYLSFASHHPIAHKIAVIKTLFCRANSICGSDQDRNIERAHIRSALKMNGYPSRVISNAMRARPASSSKVMIKPKATVVLPYIKNVSECIKRILLPLDIRTCFKPHTTLRQLLVHPKDPIPVESQTGVIYQVSCGTCHISYIGQTGRTITHRLKEHKQALTSPYHFSAVAEHAMKESHVIDWKNGKVIDICHQLYPRCYLESWYIKTKGSKINRDEGLLPQVYGSLVKHINKKTK